MALRRHRTRRASSRRASSRRASYRSRRVARSARRSRRAATRRYRLFGGAQDDAMAPPMPTEGAVAQYASPFVTNMVRY